MMREEIARSAAIVVMTAAVIFAVSKMEAATSTFTETFASTAKRDASTTAVWDTAKREVRLPAGSLKWESINDLRGKVVSAVAFSPNWSQDGTVFVGVSDGIFWSGDQGATWQRVATIQRPVESISFSPSFGNDGIGFAITNGDGLWKTSNGGSSWSRIRNANGFSVAVSPAFASDSTVFAATFEAVLKSSNAGQSWSSLTAGFDPEVIANGDIRGVAVSGSYAANRTVYATTFSFGVYKSTDAGASWTQANPASADILSATSISASGGGAAAAAFFDGVYFSRDSGETWSLIYEGEAEDVKFSPNYRTDSTILIAADSGIRRWRSGLGSVADGWPGGAAQAVGVAAAYPASGSVIGGRSSGAFAAKSSYAPSANVLSTTVDQTENRIVRATLKVDVDLPPQTTILYSLSVARNEGGSSIWEGPISPNQSWNFQQIGSDLRWMATLAAGDSTVTPVLKGLTLEYETSDELMPPAPSGSEPGTTSIRWKFRDTTSDETGYEIHADPGDRVVVTTAPDEVHNLSFLEETGLRSNASYCGRRVHTLRGQERSAASAPFPCTMTLVAVPPQPRAEEVTLSSARLLFSGGTNSNETEYAIKEPNRRRYVAGDGTLSAASPLWKKLSDWGNGSAPVSGLSSETSYVFCVVAKDWAADNAVHESSCSPNVTVRTLAPAEQPDQPPPEEPPQPDQPPPEQPEQPDQPPPEQPEQPDQPPPPDEPGGEPVVDGEQPGGQEPGGEGQAPPPEQPPAPAPEPGSVGGSAGGPAWTPTIEILYPANGSTVEGGTVAVVGASDTEEAVGIEVDGTARGAVPLNPDGTFSFTVPSLAPGSHKIIVRISGARDEVSIIVPAPSVNLIITKPMDGEETNTETLVIRGRGPALRPVSLTMDGEPLEGAAIGAAGEFVVIAARRFGEGRRELIARTTTENEIPLEARAVFVIDRTPPPAPTLSGATMPGRTPSSKGGGVFDVRIKLQGSLPETEFAKLDSLLVTIASEPVTVSFMPNAPVWTQEITVPLVPGNHTIKIAARDRAGNISAQPGTLAINVPPPQCSDNQDNDGDKLIDFPKDPDCRDRFDDKEEHEGMIERAAAAVKETTVATAKAVAKTTTQAARATAQSAEKVAVVTQKKVLDNPKVEAATELVVAPAVTVAVVANTASTVQGFQLLNYLQYFIGFLFQPGRFLSRRKRKAWGTVYSSLTKRPVDLASVRLIETAAKRVVQSAVTDALGRFSFIVQQAGTYRVEVHHPRHKFPSTLLEKAKEDPAFGDLYHGEQFTVSDIRAPIAMNIPIDTKEAALVADAGLVRRYYLHLASEGISASSPVVALVAFAISPQPWVGATLVLNVILYLLFKRLASGGHPKSWGTVLDGATKENLHLAIVRIFDQQYNKLLGTAVTNRFGHYNFLVGKNVYYVTAQKPNYELAKSQALDLTKAEGIIGVDFTLKPRKSSKA